MLAIPPVLTRRRSLSTATVITLLAIILVLLIGAGQIARSRAVALTTASQQAQNLANVLAQHAARTIESVDLILTGVQERLRNSDRTELKAFLERRAATLPQLQKLQVMNPEGDWIFDSVGAHPPLSSADRAYFKWHQQNEEQVLHIDAPITSRFEHVTVIPLSRRLSKADGSFDGVVSATLFTDHFRAFYDSIKIGKESAIALWLDDGRLLAREPAPLPAMARDISGTRLFKQTLRETSSGVLLTPSSAVDGLARIVGFQRLDRYPLVVTASVSMDDALAAWRYDAILQGVVMVIATLALGALAAGLERRNRRIVASERLSDEAQALFKGLFANATDCLYVYRIEDDGRFRLETCNPAAAAAHSIDQDGVLGRPLRDILGPDDAAKVSAELARAVATGAPVRSEDQALVGGERRIRDIIHVPLRDPHTDRITRIFVGARDITHLKTAEAEAREANRLLVLAEQVAQVGHWLLALPSMALTWSDEVYRIHGLDPAVFTPTVDAAASFYHPADREAVAGHIERAMESGVDFAFELRILRPDGTTRHVQVRGFCEAKTDDGPRNRTLFGVLADVTELKQAERALAEKSALFEATLHSMNQGLLMIAPDGTVPIANGRALELLGLPAELMALRPTYRAMREHMRRTGSWGQSIEQANYWYLDQDRRTTDLISERRRADGSVIEIRSLPTHGGDGYIQTITDITERRLAEQRLRDSEARYRLLADHTSDLIVLGDIRGATTYVSPAVTNVLGYSVAEVMSAGLIDATFEEDRSLLTASLQALNAQNPAGSVIYRMRHKAGRDVWIEAAFRWVEEAGIAQIVMALRDVTLRQRQAKHLEQAKIAAEAGARIKTEFLANMSHELRTPLTGMLGVHDLLKTDSGLSPAQIRLVGLAQESGRSLLTIVNDILDFSKMEAGELTIDAIPFGMRALIASCCELVAEPARDRNLTVITDIAPDMPDAFVGDPARLRQVLLNLATNAIKFTPSGTVTITARWMAEDGRQCLRLEVTDTGIGIAAGNLPRLFQRFSQADGSISRTYGGTGLGLAISRRLAELMGGQLGVVSDLGAGSTFWLEVPLTLHVAGRTDSLSAGAVASAPRSYKILFAEDTPINQEIIAAVLRRKGHDVETVGDGAAAVAAVEAGVAFDVVLMDVQMPGQDGLTATSLIREREAATGRRRLPIVALTANALAEEITRCREAGMDAHVAKPVDWSELFVVIDRVIRDALDHGVAQPERAAVLDDGTLEMLAEILGRHRIPALLSAFMDDLRLRIERLTAPGTTCQTLRENAHAIVSLAGQLGFIELSGLCAELDEEAEMGAGLDRLPELSAAAARAIEAASQSRDARSSDDATARLRTASA